MTEPDSSPDMTADLAAMRKALKMLDHSDRVERALALQAEAALERIGAALAPALSAKVPEEVTEAVLAYASSQFDVGRASAQLEGPDRATVEKPALDQVARDTQAELFTVIRRALQRPGQAQSVRPKGPA